MHRLADVDVLCDSIPVGLAILDTQGRYLRVNRRLAELNGVPVSEHLGRSMRDVIPNLDGAAEAILRRVIETGEPIRNAEISGTVPAQPGVVQTAMTQWLPLKDVRGNVIAVSIVLTEFTERKHWEEALQKSEAHLRQVIDTVPQLIWTALPDGSVDYCNRHWLEYTGLTHSQVQGRGWMTALHPDDRDPGARAWSKALKEGADYEVEQRLRGANGEYRRHLIRARPVQDEQGNVLRWYGTCTDIEDRKQAEERLQRLQAQLAHVARLSVGGELVAGIAHEVNQPLYSIVNYAKACGKVLEREAPDLESVRKWNQQIAAAAGRAGEIIRRLRDFVQPREPQRCPATIEALLRDAVGMLEFEARHRGITVRQEIQATPALSVDPVQIHQVLVNLLRNAYEALENGRIGPRTVAIGAAASGRFVEISIADNGPGVRPEDAQRIFESFFTTKPDGLGMGLAISRSIVEAHGGRLWLDSSPAGGATVRFTLPLTTEGESYAR